MSVIKPAIHVEFEGFTTKFLCGLTLNNCHDIMISHACSAASFLHVFRG